jgi:hypothetical protein
LSGSDRLDGIEKYNANMRKFSDDGITLWGAYGPRLIDQLDGVLKSLRDDPCSRQAVVTTWRVGSRTSLDVPCTVAWHFQIRHKMLDLTVFMRSNDVWLGLPYDLLSFTTVQRVVASVLDVGVGTYHHVVSNLHMYVENADGAKRVVEEPRDLELALAIDEIVMPDFGDEFRRTGAVGVALSFEHILRGGWNALHGESMRPFFEACGDLSVDGSGVFANLMEANGRATAALAPKMG